MKVLQINVVYGNGSTGKIVKDLNEEYINKNIKSSVIYGRGVKVKESNINKASPEWLLKLQSLRSRITGYNYSGCIHSTKKIIEQIKKTKPDIVHLHCINGYFVNIYKLLGFLKTNNYKTVLTLHAEFMYTAGCGYAYECEQWRTGCCKDAKVCPQFNKQRPKSWFFNRCNKEWHLMKKAFKDFDNLVVCPVSDWLKSRAELSPFMRDKKIITVMNGLDTNVFYYNHDVCDLRRAHNIKDEKVVLHVTPNFLSEIKGGQYVLELAERMQNKKVVFIIIGRNSIQNNLLQNVISIEHTNNQQQLAQYYSLADVSLLTSKKETFSMVCAESLCCGTPIVGFEAGAPETISIREYSKFGEYGNVNLLAENLSAFLEKKFDKMQISKQAKILYDKKTMASNYLKVYSEL